MNSNIW